MPIRIGKIKNINVAFPVVKKLPVLLIGNSSEKKVKIKGTTIILFFRFIDIDFISLRVQGVLK